MANRYRKQCSISLIIREMRIKATARRQCLLGMAVVPKTSGNKCGGGCGERESRALVVGPQTGVATVAKQYGGSLTVKNGRTEWSSMPTSGRLCEGHEMASRRHVGSPTKTGIVETWKLPKCLSMDGWTDGYRRSAIYIQWTDGLRRSVIYIPWDIIQL